jgi:hypothetical protein
MYRPIGRHLGLPHSGPQERRYLHGALCYPSGESYFRTLLRMDAYSVQQFCEALLADHPDRQIWLIMDGAPAHRSKSFTEFLQRHKRLRVQFQPTYAPWTNPVERVWQEMRRWVTHGHGIPDFTELVRVADRWCRRFQADPAAARKLASFADANPCR